MRGVILLAILALALAGCSGPLPSPVDATDSSLLPPATQTTGGIWATTGSVDPPPTATQTPTPTPEPTKSSEPAPSPATTVTPVPSGVGGPTRDVRWDEAIHTEDGGMIGVVTVDSLNIRSAPRLNAPVVGTTYQRHPITVYDQVRGDAVEGNPYWYRVGTDRYVTAAMVDPLVIKTPTATFEGHWVDIDLSNFYAVAYDGNKPVYAAMIIAGLDNKTPTGTFKVLYRVRNETMDSATVGVPKGSPGYYYLPNVQYTQYFKDGGYALHGNYWSPPNAYGRYGSHGCINLMNADAAWFWSFLTVGSVVSVHD